MDNTVAVAYINKLGGKIKTLHKLAKEIWCWCISKDIWLSAAHVPGIDNFEADSLSRNINDDAEWMLHQDIFHNIEKVVGKIDIDLFASRLNHQKQNYVSYKPDKNAIAGTLLGTFFFKQSSVFFAISSEVAFLELLNPGTTIFGFNTMPFSKTF